MAREHRETLESDKYGYIPREKPNDAWRLMFENWNSLGIFTGQSKVAKINRLCKHYSVDTLAGCEAQCDWRQVEEYESRFENVFGAGQQYKKWSVGHNVTERTVRDQKGGTAMMTMGRLAKHVIGSGCDHTGLGRWAIQRDMANGTRGVRPEKGSQLAGGTRACDQSMITLSPCIRALPFLVSLRSPQPFGIYFVRLRTNLFGKIFGATATVAGFVEGCC